jgi:diaminopimelate decarboxylase
VDFGGGFPLAVAAAPTPAQFRDALTVALGEAGLDLPPRPAIEPGRYLVGAAGWLVASVLHTRAGPARSQQVVLDAGMTEFIRPALYGSRHPVHVLRTGGGNGADRLPTALEGPVCESTDSFGSYLLPPLRRGDLVAIGQAGAYGASFTSRYNGRPPPPEALLHPDGSLERCGRPPIAGMCSLPPVRLRQEGDLA